MTRITSRLACSIGALTVLWAVSAAMAQKAPRLYEFEVKKADYLEVLQDRLVWFRVGKGFQLYDARTGQRLWAHKQLPGFDGRFTLLWNEAFLLYSTKKGVSRLDVETGDVAWEVELAKLKFKDVDRFWSTDGGILFQIKNNFTLLDPATGREKWWLPLQPNPDFANKGKPWLYDLGDRVLILAKQGPRLIDLATGNILWSVDDKLNKKLDEAITQLDERAIVYFDKRLRIVDLHKGRELAAIEGKIKEATSFEVFESGGRTYILFGFNKRLMAFDGDTGDRLWETAEGEVTGSVRWVQASPEAGKVLLVDLRSDKLGKDAGTWLTMHSVDLATGAIGWSQIIGYSQGASVFVNQAFANRAKAATPSNLRNTASVSIWFDRPIIEGDDVVFLIRGVATGDPLTKKRKESQGLLSVNARTGEVNYLTRVEILHPKGKLQGYAKLGVTALNDPHDAYPSPLDLGPTLVVAGRGELVAVDKASGQVRWRTEMPGLTTSLRQEGGAIVAQVGKMVVWSSLEKGGKIKTDGLAVGPFGFVALDAASGQVQWQATDFKVDPTQALAAAVDDGVLYGCDGNRLYALSLADGTYRWQFDIDKDGKAGKITGNKAWAVQVEKSVTYGLQSITTTTTWSNPRRILRPEYRGSHFVVFADKAIIRVNKDGKLAWRHEWKYSNNQKDLLMDPVFAGPRDDVVYACKGFTGVDGVTGETKWFDKDVKGEFYRVGDDLLIVHRKDEVQGYSLD